MGRKTLRLQRSESFYIRDGWFEKILQSINEGLISKAFSKSDGPFVLGIGSNMVKSLQYWAEAADLITKVSNSKKERELGGLGQLIMQSDPYLESVFSWGLIHYKLATNFDDAPVFYTVFNDPNITHIQRKETTEYLCSIFKDEGFENVNENSIQKDISVLISSYIEDDDRDRTPEQNITCPLSQLRLFRKTKEGIEKATPPLAMLDYRLLYICLRIRYGNDGQFNIDDSLHEEMSPALVFNLGRSALLSYLLEMKKYNLVDLNRTAGLDVVYFRNSFSDEELFSAYNVDKRNNGSKI